MILKTEIFIFKNGDLQVNDKNTIQPVVEGLLTARRLTFSSVLLFLELRLIG